jgi:hypothetical protein
MQPRRSACPSIATGLLLFSKKIGEQTNTAQLALEYFCKLEYLTSAVPKKQTSAFFQASLKPPFSMRPLTVQTGALCFLPSMSETPIP